jgi:hypothetical protein
MSVVSLFNKKSLFENVIKDTEAVHYHYRRYSMGDRDQLARECFQYVESSAYKELPWAVHMRKEVYKR